MSELSTQGSLTGETHRKENELYVRAVHTGLSDWRETQEETLGTVREREINREDPGTAVEGLV